MRRFSLPLAFALTAAFAFTGCDSSEPNDGVAPPVLAPAAFSFDLAAEFPGATAHAQGGAGEHFVQAAARVTLVSAVVGAHLVIPGLATDAATDVQPVVEDGTWIWENRIPGDNDVTFRLEGTPEGQRVDWRMLISAEEPIDGQTYDDFVLYTATTALDGRDGSWQLFYLIDGERTRVLDADFEVTSATVSGLMFTIPETNPNHDAHGSTVHYGRNGNSRSFIWHQEPEDFDHHVHWDVATDTGRLEATNYNDGEPACWDESLQDTACVPVTAP